MHDLKSNNQSRRWAQWPLEHPEYILVIWDPNDGLISLCISYLIFPTYLYNITTSSYLLIILIFRLTSSLRWWPRSRSRVRSWEIRQHQCHEGAPPVRILLPLPRRCSGFPIFERLREGQHLRGFAGRKWKFINT